MTHLIHRLPFVASTVIVAILITQDNAAGRLDTESGLWWLLVKIGIVVAVLLVVKLFRWICWKLADFGRWWLIKTGS